MELIEGFLKVQTHINWFPFTLLITTSKKIYQTFLFH